MKRTKAETYRDRAMAVAMAARCLRTAAADFAQNGIGMHEHRLFDAALDFAAKARTLAGRNG